MRALSLSFRNNVSRGIRADVRTRSLPSSKPSIELGYERFDWSRFHSDGLIGNGSFGIVYQAFDRKTNETVAIKEVLKRHPRRQLSKSLHLLRREVELLRILQLASTNVVELYGVYEDSDSVYIVTELLDQTLEEFRESVGGAVDERTLKWIVQDVLEFVRACHVFDIVYCDTKPSNFMLARADDGSWKVKAIDLGCSQLLRNDEELLYKRSGTPMFFAPEVHDRAFGKEADVWSVGILVYVLATGNHPRKAYETDIPEIDEDDWRGISPLLRDLIQRMLCVDPRDRITVAQALAHDFFSVF